MCTPSCVGIFSPVHHYSLAQLQKERNPSESNQFEIKHKKTNHLDGNVEKYISYNLNIILNVAPH